MKMEEGKPRTDPVVWKKKVVLNCFPWETKNLHWFDSAQFYTPLFQCACPPPFQNTQITGFCFKQLAPFFYLQHCLQPLILLHRILDHFNVKNKEFGALFLQSVCPGTVSVHHSFVPTYFC